MEILCTQCGQPKETDQEGDFSTYICEECSDKANVPAWEKELKDLEAQEFKTESEEIRIKWLKDKLASIGKKPAEL